MALLQGQLQQFLDGSDGTQQVNGGGTLVAQLLLLLLLMKVQPGNTQADSEAFVQPTTNRSYRHTIS